MRAFLPQCSHAICCARLKPDYQPIPSLTDHILLLPLCVCVCCQVLRIRSIIETEPVMVVDERMRIVYASANLAKLLCASGTSLTELSLPALIPPPAAQLHKQWIAVGGAFRPYLQEDAHVMLDCSLL